MTKVQRFLFAISMTAVWCLIMPPYLYGILGIPVTFIFTWAVGRQLPDVNRLIREKFRWYVLPLVLLIFYMLCTEFVEQWELSSKMYFFANLFGISVKTFLISASIAGAAVACYGVLFLVCAVMGAAPQKSFPEIQIDAGNRKLDRADVLFALVITLCLGMRLALNPWSDVLTGNDSAAYIYVGMMMRKGSVLYVDIFEHKGIFLYLIDAAGMAITDGSLTGIWLLELLNAFVTCLFILKVTKLFTTKKTVQYLTVAASIAALTVCMLLTDGNLSEEWVLPWITLSLYICLKYMIDHTYHFYEIILLGIGCAFIIFMRANMIAVFAAFLPIILIQMIRKKQWREIGICALNFTLGLAVVAVPVLIYSIATGSLEGMMKCYFLFSMSYCKEGGLPIGYVVWRLFRRQTIYSVALLGATRIFYKNPVYQMNLWFYGLSLVAASMSGRAHPHYSIILIPALILPMTVLLSSVKGISFQKPAFTLTALGVGFFAAQFGVSLLTYREIPLSPVAQYLQEYTKEDDNVLMMGNNCIYYLEGGRYTTNRYYYQTPAVNVSDELYEEFIEELTETKPEAVFAVGDMEKLLEEDENITKAYELLDTWSQNGVYSCETYDTFTVYRRHD